MDSILNKLIEPLSRKEFFEEYFFNLATRYWLSFENRGVLVSIFGKEILEIIVLAGESKNFIYYHLKVSIILYKSTFK